MAQNNLEQRISEIQSQVSNIQGWLHDRDGAVLYRLVRDYVHTPTVVELGAWKGRSTVWLAQAIKDRGDGRVYSVDTWKGTPGEEAHASLLRDYTSDQLYNEFLSNLSKFELDPYVKPMRMDTTEAARQFHYQSEIGLLFIDAGHEYTDVRRDFEFWSPMVEVGGFIVFDDVPAWPGPSKLITELPRWYEFVASGSNNWVVRKVE